MSVLAHHAAFVCSVAALAAAAVRIASRWASGGAERVLAAAAVGCTIAVLETLALGFAGAGGSTLALTAAAVLTWLVTTRLAPAPDLRVGAELGRWWRGLGSWARVAWGAGLAAFAWWVAWVLVWPPMGFDASLYQYVEVVNWVRDGDPGSVQQVSYEFPVGNYPLANEVLLAWGTALARSFVPLTLWPAAAWALTGLAGWSGLRRLSGPRIAALGTAVVLTIPSFLGEVGEPDTDLPALCWLAVAGALAAGAVGGQALLAPALLAAGLAIGTKTTVAPLAVVVVAVGWLGARPRVAFRSLVWAGAAALVVGGFWYARNLIDHGSPFWPFRPGPFGDPTPRWLATVDSTFLERPRATLDQVPLRSYVKDLGASLLLLPAAFAAPLLVRRRSVLIAAVVTGAGLLLWMNAPATGVPPPGEVLMPAAWPESAMRYLLPVFAAAVVTLALAAGTGAPRVVAGAAALLGLAIVVNAAVLVDRAAPLLPPAQVLLAAAIGALAVVVAARFARRAEPRASGRARPLAVVALGALAVLLSLSAGGLVERHAGMEQSTALGRDVITWLSGQPGFGDGDEPIGIASRAMIAPVAGDRLQHPVELIPARESCPRVLARARRGWVVASEPSFARSFLGIEPVTAPLCLKGERPLFSGHNFDVYRLR